MEREPRSPPSFLALVRASVLVVFAAALVAALAWLVARAFPEWTER
ncbi:MAG: hypothetical protein ACKVWV_06240 [Planctomycetota bacterium]